MEFIIYRFAASRKDLLLYSPQLQPDVTRSLTACTKPVWCRGTAPWSGWRHGRAAAESDPDPARFAAQLSAGSSQVMGRQLGMASHCSRFAAGAESFHRNVTQ